MLLDLGLPGIDGLDVVRGLRGWSSVPIVVVSARDAERTKVAALDAGADDYVTKPFGIDELLARVRAALRRHQPASDTAVVRTADFTVDLAAGEAWRARRGGAPHARPSGRWSASSSATRAGSSPNSGCSSRCGARSTAARPPTCASTSAALRRKLEPNPSQPRYFITEPGMGYRFEPGDEPQANDSPR